jgi:hypothetical protein
LLCFLYVSGLIGCAQATTETLWSIHLMGAHGPPGRASSLWGWGGADMADSSWSRRNQDPSHDPRPSPLAALLGCAAAKRHAACRNRACLTM